MPLLQSVYNKNNPHGYQHIFGNVVFHHILPEIIDGSKMHESIDHHYNGKKDDAADIKFMKKRKCFLCFQESDHKKHEEPYAEALKDEIQVGFKEKSPIV